MIVALGNGCRRMVAPADGSRIWPQKMVARKDGGQERWWPRATVAGKWRYYVEQREKDGLIRFHVK